MLPEGFEARMRALLGSEYGDFLASFDRPLCTGLRRNPLKTGFTGDLSRFSLSPVPWCPTGFYYDAVSRPGLSPYHAAGLYYLQEPSAMAPAELLDPQPGERVLDLCAAPGGKTILLARFVPIVRAFAPLIAGAARMNGIRFELFSGAGAILWAVSIVGAGYLFGNIPFIKNNLSLILLLGIIAAISGPVLVGMVWKFIQKRKGLDAEDPQK